ncbi:MAG TPA: aminopeptidase P family protein [candidate division Zixibacteria bacterium]|nr:aminopeptidase P family protein [candidate division Zixibacteria bacterium]
MRIDKIRAKIIEAGLDSALITNLVNVRFLCGFSGSNGLLLIYREGALFITDFRYKTQSAEEVKGAEIAVSEGVSIFETLAERPELKAIGKIGFEKSLTLSAIEDLKSLLPDNLEWEPMEDFFNELRAVKNSDEVAKIRKAIFVAEEAMRKALAHLQPGISERDFAAELEYNMRKLGADRQAFDTIVVSGKRSALVHGIASDKTIEAGDFVTIDYGAKVDGFHSDITRTYIMGEPSDKQRQIYETVFRAQASAIESARPGMMGKELDAVARDIIEEAGFGEFFGHGLGHGLGLLVHDVPRAGSKSENILPEGAVITIEPGIYIPDFGGVRIEDDVLLTADGCEVLTSLPKAIDEVIIR